MYPQPWKTWIRQDLEKSFSKFTLGLNILLLARAIPQIHSFLGKKNKNKTSSSSRILDRILRLSAIQAKKTGTIISVII